MSKVLIVLVFAGMVAASGCGGSASNVTDVTSADNTVVVAPTFPDANAALAEGTRLLDENDTQGAIAALKQAVEMNPDLAEAYFKLGVAYALEEMQLERAGEAVPVQVEGEGKKKTSKLRSEIAFEKAVEAYKKWLKDNPKDDVAHFYLGRTYSKLLKDEEAEKEFEEAVKLKPDDTEYQSELGAVLIKLAKYHEAIPALKKAIELDPSNDRAIELLEYAEAGRQRVNYVSKDADANKAANKLSNTNTNTSDSNSNSAPPANTKLPPPVKPVSTPTRPTPAGAQKEVPRGRVPNPPVGRPNSQ